MVISSGSSSTLHAPSSFWVTVAFVYMYVAWGVTYLAIHSAVQTIPPMIMAGSRILLAGTVMLAALRFSRAAEFHWGTAREWKDAAIVAMLLLVGGNGVQACCQRYVPTSVTSLLFGTIPLWIILFDWVRPNGTAPTRRTFWGLGLGFIGVGVLVNPHGSGAATSGSVFRYEILLLLAACSFAAGSVYSRYVQAGGSPLLPMARQMIVGGVVMLVFSLLHRDWNGFTLGSVSIESWLGFGYLVTFGSLLGFTLFVWLMRVSTPARVATISYVNLLVAVVLGWWLLHEPLTGRLVLGAAITRSDPSFSCSSA